MHNASVDPTATGIPKDDAFVVIEGNKLLPPGIYKVTLAEVQRRFGTALLASERGAREKRYRDLLDLIAQLKAKMVPATKLILGGSFTAFLEDRPLPGDLDGIIILSCRRSSLTPEQRTFIDDGNLKHHYGDMYALSEENDAPTIAEKLKVYSETRAIGGAKRPRGVILIELAELLR